MRGLFASLLVAVFFMVIALVATAFGAVGIAFIGSLLHRWFDLTQWQGTLVALAGAFGLGFLIYRMANVPAAPTWNDDWGDDEDEIEDDPDIATPEDPIASPIVPWRRNRPTPGELPPTGNSSGKRSRK